MKIVTRKSLSTVLAARADAIFERSPDPPRPNAERIHGDAQPRRQIAPAIDALPPRIAVVADDQVLLFRLQLAKASVEALEAPLLNERGVVSIGGRRRCDGISVAQVVELDVPSFSTQILEQDEPGDHIAVTQWRFSRDGAGLFQGSADPIERVIGERVWGRSILSIEVRDEPAAYFQVPFTFRVGAVVQPREEARERRFCECRFLLSNLLSEHGGRHMQET
jgi:hypothetical protein